MQPFTRILFLIHFLLLSTLSISGFGQNLNDTLRQKDTLEHSISKNKDNSLDTKIIYHSKDSIVFDLNYDKAYLYGDAEVTYGETNLKAAYIEIDFNTKLIFASFNLDSNNKEIGIPVFKDKEETFKAKKLTYNFETKKGIIHEIYSEQAGGFMHGEKVKKQADNSVLVKNGAFTTCNLDHPHFAIKFDKAKVIPNDKIVTGPAYLSIEDIPTPLVVPFGYFPNSKKQKNGILIPGFANSVKRGYGLEKGGYYIGINEHLDMSFRGDIYTRGSWALTNSTRYKKRYKYDGNIELKYAKNIFGEKGASDYQLSRDYQIIWTHNQDPKAHPKSRFSANVNAGSSNFDKNNSYNPEKYLRNQMNSSISYNTKLFNFLYLNTALTHSQNNSSKLVNMSLPGISLSSDVFFPFKKMMGSGKRSALKDFTKNISIRYSSDFRNEINTADSLLFTPGTLENLKNGMVHRLPISSTIKLFNYISVSPSIRYSEYWYFSHIEKSWNQNTNNLTSETVKGFKAAHDLDFNANVSTKAYGLVKFKKGPVVALRHVFTPSYTYTYHPDFFSRIGQYNQMTQADTLGTLRTYNIFEGSLFGSPNPLKTQIHNIQIANNLEMKVRSKKDTITGTKKIQLIDNFTLGSSFNAEKDSLKWDYVYMNARTRLFKCLDVNYRSIWDPYVLDSATNKRLNIFEFKENNRLLRKTNVDWNLSLSWNISSNSINQKNKTQKEAKTPEEKQEMDFIEQNPNAFVDFNNPWNFSIHYSFIHSKTLNEYTGNKNKIIKTLSFRGDVNITKKWKIGFSSGYDFNNKDFSYTTVDIYRDLHCWELNFHWIPFGLRKSYFLTINVKSSMLQDLKLTKRRDWKDL